MEAKLKRFLEFQGKNVYFKTVDGVWWVAIKPICDALTVNYNRQFQNLKGDSILGQLFAMQQMVAADGRLRKMVCLPEFYVYGWIFQIQSDSLDLHDYKWKCYELLYNYFHGTITDRVFHLMEETKMKSQLEELNKKIFEQEKESPLYQERAKLADEIRKHRDGARKADKTFVSRQLELWS